ncbi:MAG: alkaline phosphatase [Planctomycetia bacterium]|nr:alkaline phosphatase [Planctomycetia bacterium]
MKISRKRIILFLLMAWLCCGITLGQELSPVKYVFLFIGDGMSVPQRMLAEEYAKKTNRPGLYLNSFPNHALTITGCVYSCMTDSAASGTAIACGEKTGGGQLGLDASGTRRLESVAEAARDAGRKVGIITSVTLNNATPAAFYAHNMSRGAGYEINLDLLDSGFDYFAGGAVGSQDDKKSARYSGVIFDLAKQKGYTVLHDANEILALTPDRGRVIACQKEGPLPFTIDWQEGLTLAEYTKKGIEMLDNPNGFFMMVEGGKIDWACHANDAASAVWETLALDDAVQVAGNFMKEHPNETIIVVTGDHETGGLTLGYNETGQGTYIELLSYQKCSLDFFIQKLAAFGKEKGNDLCIADVQAMITENLGLLFSAENKEDRLLLNEAEQIKTNEAITKFLHNPKEESDPLARTVVKILNNKASLGWTTSSHTALPVDTSAIGVQSERFNGLIDNTDIAKRLKQMIR